MAGDVGAYVQPEHFEDLQISVYGTQNLIDRLVQRVDYLENKIEHMEKIMTGGTTKATERALILNDAVRSSGFLKRSEVNSLLKCHPSESLRAMEEAAEMFTDLHVTKNRRRWILAVISQ